MKIELNPNCSEVVLRLDHDGDITDEEIKFLEFNGIKQVEIDSKEYWGRDWDDKKEVCFFDIDNKNQPDFEWQSHLHIATSDYGNGPLTIVGHQHCQPQLFKTMKKIKGIIGGEWEGHDGGSTFDYKEWIDKGEKEVMAKLNRKKKYRLLREKYNPFKL